jgi:thioredoxin-related protein
MSLNAFPQENAEVKWHTMEEALKKNKQNPKIFFIDIYTDWCGWCKRMDANTFSHPVIASYLNNHFYPVKFDAESTDPVQVGDKTFENNGTGRRATHDLAAALLQGKLSYPSFVFLSNEIQIITILKGYKTPGVLEPILAFFAENAHKSMEYQEFEESFDSQID